MTILHLSHSKVALDQVQAGIRQVKRGEKVDSVTSVALQKTGMSQNTANLVDAGISVVGSAGAGITTAGLKVATIRATDPLAKGLSTASILSQTDAGAAALNNADFLALGGTSTTPLAKFRMMEAGVDASGAAYQLTTTGWQGILKSIKLSFTGPTPSCDILVGFLGAAGGASQTVNPEE